MNNSNPEIPEMNLEGKKYSTDKPIIPANISSEQKEFEKVQKDLEKLKGFIIKKFPFTQAIGILPATSIPIFVDEEEVPKETEKFMHLYMVVPEEEYKNIGKIQKQIIPELEKLKQKTWLQIKTPVDISENCFDSKFDLHSSIALSYPIYDKGILESLRVAEIHKSLTLRKFEKYVVSYVIGGSFIRGDVTKESDVDTFVIINDTDVRKMPRVELRERLRSQINQFISEAEAMAGVAPYKLNVQIYLLTEFWDAVKDANPVMFTFIRDGVPIYDQGTFMPWKSLLRMGKLKPSPEAIDTFMKSGESTRTMVERRLLDAMIDIYYGVLNPTQALVMLYGAPPPTPKEAAKVLEDIFVKKEKLLEKKYVTILAKAIKYFKDYEHQKIKTVPGKEVDKLLEEFEDYMKRLKSLREQIEKRTQEKTIEEIYQNATDLLTKIFGKKSVSSLIGEFEENLVKKGKMTQNHLKILRNIVGTRTEFKKGKLDSHKVDNARKEATGLINDLIEYTQRCELANSDRKRFVLKSKNEGHLAELFVCKGESYLVFENVVRKITDKVYDSSIEELTKALEARKENANIEINPEIFDVLKKSFGEFEIIL